MTAIRLLTAWWTLAAAITVSGPGIGAAALGQTQPDARTSAPATQKFEGTLAKAAKQFEAGDADGAYSLYRQAARLHEGPCAECFLGMAYVDLARLRLESAIALAQKAAAIPGVKPVLASEALEVVARSHYRLGKRTGDTREFASGESALRGALLQTSDRASLHYYHGLALLGQARDAEGVAELRLYTAAEPTGERTRLATQFIADPSQGHADAMYDFTGTTVDGKALDTQALRGKVLVLDFWASWCAPCRASLPEVRRIAARMAGEPIVVIGVSDDRDEKKWREFVAKNGMTWPQIYQRNLMWYYGVTGIPTYVVIDKGGFIRAQVVGGGKKRWDELQKAIDECLK
jgi:thiol-disulfide isomerase/thioredoxin